MSENRVVVCGGGMAGLSAAITALEQGVAVTLCEKAPQTGGSAAISGGVIWGFSDFERMQAEAPHADAALQWLVYDELDAARTWLASQGVRLSPAEDNPALGRRERTMEPPQAMAALADRFLSLGGELRLESALEGLIAREGAIRGVRLALGDRVLEEPARAVVLATGGFQGNPEMLSRYVVRDPDNLYLRSSPWSTGDGFLAAERLGASASAGLDTFYGHALALPPSRIPLFELRDITQWYGQQSIAVNIEGERFVDESDGNSEHALNQRLARQPRGRGFYIVDQDSVESPAIHGKPTLTRVVLERARARKAPMAVASTIEELCRELAGYGVPAPRLMRTIGEFNALIESGRGDELTPPRRRNRKGLRRPPFYAVAVQASITFTMGGLHIDEHARVLRRAGGTSPLASVPASRASFDTPVSPIAIGSEYRQTAIAGLYACGADAGNICHFGYVGGLGPALVTGRTAGASAAAFLERSA
ncbi:MAG: FAD-dependent oxidoreductase [Burkholderiales bacterium]|nr:FAD-dependent oxidoreductase [Burkholderiales bacterium]